MLALAAARGLHMAGLFGLFGTILLAVYLPGTEPLNAGLRRLVRAFTLAAFGFGLAWFLLQSADMASARSVAELLTALPIVLQSTRFGHLLALRLLLLGLACGGFEIGARRLAGLAAGIAVISEAWLGHGGAMTGTTGWVLLASTLLHLAGGAAWIGSLPALFLMISRTPAPEAAVLARRYSALGTACVAAILASAAVQFVFLIGSPAALFSSRYGNAALTKILLFAGLILLAAINRLRLTPALFTDPGAKPRILFSIGCEIALGLMALLAAGWLLQLAPPAMAGMAG